MKEIDVNNKFWVVKFYKKWSIMIGLKHNNKMFHMLINKFGKGTKLNIQTEADLYYINNKIKSL